ncbi:spermidine/putrescine transport system permease protein [Rhizobium leguminosarum]|uniref:Spermidine/putrescine transport system permease protein n=1 Tax=Rhizobium leguminosarum TaxID=384 RepID=A0AAE2MPM6_RHILE|nr:MULTISPECIES: ABC transporter permease [Rhizobium]MBB4293243.1 spermidine/putrescine transport system permease protein [Rhizobium leguminosarum]MBB4299934.1 spermidine/putrescine transport system permease protein [Rhizobium leguminosarum]MBB4311060.1 spermidine/putrescine transport system permease protein [Rhizobium leguminosarum]MBB4436659.1 spermidine/putrescine transport system permease protein [Rhizobium esperanzae]MBB4532219.1 spermidine/putrescine transport system permease protein [Rh
MIVTRRNLAAFAALFSIPLGWALIFLIIPYAVMIAVGFWTRQFPLFVPDFQWGNFAQLFNDPQYTTVILRTLKIALLVTLGATLLGYPLAYFLAFTVKSQKWRNLLYMSVIVPLWVSYLLRAYTWKIILGTNGALNSLLLSLGLVDQPLSLFLYNQATMVITLVYIFIPFMVMPLFTVLDNVPKAFVEASEDLGVGPFMTFWRVIFPLSLGGLIAGATMTFCLSFGDFVAPVLVGGPDGTMVANLLQSQFGAALNWPLGSALATLVLILVLVVLTVSSRFDRTGHIDMN